ncbi:kinase-like domain-containing protein [Ustulina deusta]|nr:kinase-like domain-containing protein [Ustulina deusta]
MRGGEGIIILKNHSRHGTYARSSAWNRTLVESQRAISEQDRELEIVIGNIEIRIVFPDHRLHEFQWQQYWSAYCAKYALQAPALNSLKLSSGTTLTSIPWQNRYIKVNEIGRGSFGSVYCVIHAATGELYAAKDYHKSDDGGEINLPMLKSLSHENIVKFHEVCHQPPALIMELIQGPTLKKTNQERAVEGNELQDVAWQLSDALAYLHERHLTHRDIKPANIVVPTRNPIHVKIVDFGLATVKEGTIKSFVGTPRYNAPELRRKSYTNKVDIWSLGIIILEFSYGLPPREEDTWHERVIEYMAEQPPSAFRKFITSILQIDPRVRPSAAELRDCHFPVFYSRTSSDAVLRTSDTHASSSEEDTEQRTSLPRAHAVQHGTGSTLPPDETTVQNTEPCRYSSRRPMQYAEVICQSTPLRSASEIPETSLSPRGDSSVIEGPTYAPTPGGHSGAQDFTNYAPTPEWHTGAQDFTSCAPTPKPYSELQDIGDEIPETPWSPRGDSSPREDTSGRRTPRPSWAPIPTGDYSGVQDVAGGLWGMSPQRWELYLGEGFVSAPTPGGEYFRVSEDTENRAVEDSSEVE